MEIYTDQTFIRNQSSHDRFIEIYGWDWGYRNKMLSQQFENKLSGYWWDKSENIYQKTIQKELFHLHINVGPLPDLITP